MKKNILFFVILVSTVCFAFADDVQYLRQKVQEVADELGWKPKYVEPYLDKLQWFADNDLHRVVRIHSAGAVRVTKKALEATKNINE